MHKNKHLRQHSMSSAKEIYLERATLYLEMASTLHSLLRACYQVPANEVQYARTNIRHQECLIRWLASQHPSRKKLFAPTLCKTMQCVNSQIMFGELQIDLGGKHNALRHSANSILASYLVAYQNLSFSCA